MFESKSVAAHLARGVIGVGALGVAVATSTPHPWAMIIALPAALLALRGCPLCWMVGLVETIRGRRTGGCPDGRCGTRRVNP